MKKTIALSAVSLYLSTLILSVSAQTAEPANTNSQGGTTLIGQVVAVVGVAVVFTFIAYAGYRMVKKWSSSQTD